MSVDKQQTDLLFHQAESLVFAMMMDSRLGDRALGGGLGGDSIEMIIGIEITSMCSVETKGRAKTLHNLW